MINDCQSDYTSLTFSCLRQISLVMINYYQKFEAELMMVILYCRGRYSQIDFKVVMEAAKAELLNFVGKDPL